MINYFNNNCDNLLRLKPKYFGLIKIFFLFLIFILLMTFYLDIDDIYYSKAYVECENECVLTLTLPINDVKKIKDINYISIEDKINTINSYDISDIQVDFDKGINYQIMTIITNNNLTNKTIQDIKIYYNKEKIIKKLFKHFLN